MFNLGFTLEELMFPENYPMNFFSQMETNYLVRSFTFENVFIPIKHDLILDR